MEQQQPTEPTFQPETFGKYYLVDRVATGGMAEIFKAKTYSTAGFEKLQVIKRILSHLSDNEEFVSMFIDEAKISVSLQHANLVQIYDFGKLRNNYYIAMELVEGKDVKQLLRKLAQKRKLMPEDFAVYIAHEVCKGLDYAHRKTNLQGEPLNIIHRDMSPSNVLVSYSGEVKIADFGIAKAEMSTYTTKDGVLKGKFEYMSPEQARGDEVKQASDLFSVGIILYEMLTGRRLFKCDNEIQTLEKIKAVAIRPPSSMNPNIPPRLDEIVMKALAKDVKDRYADAREFQQDLLEYMYPNTPPVIQRTLAHFMEQTFEVERGEERTRLEQGSKAALALHQTQEAQEAQRAQAAAAVDWEETPSSTTMRPEPRRLPTWAVAVVLLALLLAVGSAVWLAMNPPEPQVVEVQVNPTRAALVVKVSAPARVLLDGQPAGEGTKVSLGDLSPGAHTLRVEAEGYLPYEENLTLEAGDRLVLPVSLQPVPPKVDPTPPKVESRPPEVKDPGRKSPEVKAPPEEPRATAMGKVNISLAASNRWANVYVDGKKVGTTPLFNHTLPVGKHTIRVVNEDIGLDKSNTVTVTADEVARVAFSLD